jgi:hypothetical protein
MDQDRINNEIISIDQISSEQNLQIDNQQDEKSNEIDDSTMTTELLYVSFFSFSIII